MDFAPLAYIWGTLTIWHILIWLALSLLVGVVVPRRFGCLVSGLSLPMFLYMLAIAYGIFALMFGQVFGNTYSWSQIWPSGALLGGAFGALAFSPKGLSQSLPLPVALFSIAMSAAFFAVGLWLLPRMVGLGPIDWPKLSWGVQL
jgi:hypothetical protein